MKTLGMICAVAMPLFNIPLILRIWRRKSSEDISLAWVIGVWICVMGMLPSSLQSTDPVLVGFSIANSVFFTAVFLVVLAYHPTVRKHLNLGDPSTKR